MGNAWGNVSRVNVRVKNIAISGVILSIMVAIIRGHALMSLDRIKRIGNLRSILRWIRSKLCDSFLTFMPS